MAEGQCRVLTGRWMGGLWASPLARPAAVDGSRRTLLLTRLPAYLLTEAALSPSPALLFPWFLFSHLPYRTAAPCLPQALVATTRPCPAKGSPSQQPSPAIRSSLASTTSRRHLVPSVLCRRRLAARLFCSFAPVLCRCAPPWPGASRPPTCNSTGILPRAYTAGSACPRSLRPGLSRHRSRPLPPPPRQRKRAPAILPSQNGSSVGSTRALPLPAPRPVASSLSPLAGGPCRTNHPHESSCGPRLSWLDVARLAERLRVPSLRPFAPDCSSSRSNLTCFLAWRPRTRQTRRMRGRPSAAPTSVATSALTCPTSSVTSGLA